jgi:hypothetical protein
MTVRITALIAALVLVMLVAAFVNDGEFSAAARSFLSNLARRLL